MRKRLVVMVIITALLVTIFCLSLFVVLLRPKELVIEAIDLTSIPDGNYIGISQNKLLFSVVKVTVKERSIVSIEVLEHKKSYLIQAELISKKVIEEQSLAVDAISGATLTSHTVLKSIENALK